MTSIDSTWGVISICIAVVMMVGDMSSCIGNEERGRTKVRIECLRQGHTMACCQDLTGCEAPP